MNFRANIIAEVLRADRNACKTQGQICFVMFSYFYLFLPLLWSRCLL